MYTPLTRLILIIGSIIISVYLYSTGEFLIMSLSLLIAVLMIYGYFRYGTVYTAFQYLKKGNFEKTRNLISTIKNPNTLSKGQKGYYHFIVGMLASNDQKWEESYSELKEALNIGMRTKNNTSILYLNLANIEIERMNYEKANEFLEKVREFDLKPSVKSEVDQLQNKIDLAQENL